MKKMLTLQDVLNSQWKDRLCETFGGNLKSAFIHGNCLYEGFDALHEPWQLSLILTDTSANKLSPTHAISKRLAQEGLQLGFLFSEDFIVKNQKEYPLEFLHISRRNEVICGDAPLQGFEPDIPSLRYECRRELSSRLLQLKREFTRLHFGLTPMDFFIAIDAEILPILYGLYYIQKNVYPTMRSDVYSIFPDLEVKEPTTEYSEVIARADAYFKKIQIAIEEL